MEMNNEKKGGGIIIKFDIGGQIYQIPKCLLQQFPNAMLYMAVSDVEESNDDPIFIDRNGYRFQYVYEYIHHHVIDWSLVLNRGAFYKDMEYYGFRCHHDIYFPKDVMYLDEVQYHHVKWDVSRASTGLLFENKNEIMKSSNAISANEFKSVMGAIGFTSGVHFWSLEILEADNNCIMIGVSNNIIVTQHSYPGWEYADSKSPAYSCRGPRSSDGWERGVSYNGQTGNCSCDGHRASFGPSFGKGDVIGTLLNMNRKTVTFYKNGIRVGTAIDSDKFVGKEYYPCVSITGDRQEISSVSQNTMFDQNQLKQRPFRYIFYDMCSEGFTRSYCIAYQILLTVLMCSIESVYKLCIGRDTSLKPTTANDRDRVGEDFLKKLCINAHPIARRHIRSAIVIL